MWNIIGRTSGTYSFSKASPTPADNIDQAPTKEGAQEIRSILSVSLYFGRGSLFTDISIPLRAMKHHRIPTGLKIWISHSPSVECVGLPTLPPNVSSMFYPSRPLTCRPFTPDLLAPSGFSKAHVIYLGCVANTIQQMRHHATQRNW